MSTDVKFDQKPPATPGEIPPTSAGTEEGTVKHVNEVEDNPETENEWRQIFAQLSDYISLDVITKVFEQYQSVFVVILIFLAAIVTAKVTIAVLDVLQEIPLLAPTLELIGLAYTVWFVYRYLWEAEKRSELVQELNKLKNQVFG